MLVELKPNLYHPEHTAVWISADDIEQTTYYMLDHYDIEWDCKPKLEWFGISDESDRLIFELPELQLIPLPNGCHTMRVVSGVNRLLWIMGTGLNQVMVMIQSDQCRDWADAGFRIHPAKLGDMIQVSEFDIDGMTRFKRGLIFRGLRDRLHNAWSWQVQRLNAVL